MRALKGLVIGMGVALVLGMTVVIVTVVKRGGFDEPEQGGSASSDATGTPRVPVARGFGDRRVTMPAGATVQETTIGDGRIVVRLRLADGTAALLLIDAKNGDRLGLVRLDGGQN
jgi:hypothetical protein